MRRSYWLAITVLLICGSVGLAQESPKSGGLFAPLDRIGQRLMSGIFAVDPKASELPGRSPSVETEASPAHTHVHNHATPSATASAVHGRTSAAQSRGLADSQTARPSNSGPRPSGVHVPVKKSPSVVVAQPQQSRPATEGVSKAAAKSKPTPPAAPIGSPLHQRLMVFRHSAFPTSPPAADSSAPGAAETADGHAHQHLEAQPGVPRQVSRQPEPQSSARTLTPRVPTPAPPIATTTPRSQEPTLAPPPSVPAYRPTPAPTVAPDEPYRSAANRPVQIAQQPSPTLADSQEKPKDKAPTPQPQENLVGPRYAERPMAPPALSGTTTEATPAGNAAAGDELGIPTAPKFDRPVSDLVEDAAAPKAAESEDDPIAVDEPVLIERQSPIIQVRTLGPRRISVGKEGIYQIIVENTGNLGADQVTVSVDLPEWADVLSAETTTGATNVDVRPGSRTFTWKIPHLPEAGQELLKLRIVPRQSKPFDLAVKWDFVPPATETQIEVQEAKLELSLDGPREILYGESAVYRLELANTGTGDAENLSIALLPMGSRTPVSHHLGNLPAGEKKVVEIEMTARQIGQLTIQIDAHADGNAQAHLSETISVLRPDLRVQVLGPPAHFVGQTATYRAVVQNPGTAAAKNVRLMVTLPAGFELIDYQGDARMAEDNRTVQWTIPSLAPGESAERELTCRFQSAGASRMTAVCTADGNLNAAGDIITQIEAVPDLRLTVIDPTGPVPIGKPAEYKIIVENRGTKAAENVKVTGYFSRGIEPTTAVGQPHRILPGQVIFEPIPFLGPGEKATLTITAEAEDRGNHVFRAELSCEAAETHLVAEETTYFFQTPGSDAAAGQTRYAERRDSAPLR